MSAPSPVSRKEPEPLELLPTLSQVHDEGAELAQYGLEPLPTGTVADQRVNGFGAAGVCGDFA